MTHDPSHVWRPTGLRWNPSDSEAPALMWRHADAAGAEAASPLRIGERLAFGVGADRMCVGVWRGGRRIPCLTASSVAPHIRGGQCPGCVAADRSSSIAADTRIDDPRPFAVYLAHHGEGLIKVGITAVERGRARLLEQGALASVIAGQGSLPTARRTENVLGTVLGLPDRVTARAKRAARRRPGEPARRLRALEDMRATAQSLPNWPETLTPVHGPAADHAAAYGLPDDGVGASREVAALAPGDTIAGRLRHIVGPDLYLGTARGLVLIDSRLLAGWALLPAADSAHFTAALGAPEEPEPDVLF